MTMDPALTRSSTTPGRLTFVWADGDLVWSALGEYPVLMAVIAHRGAYRWDRAYGTLLHKVTRERSTTGSQLAAYAGEGGAQVEAAGLATNVRTNAERLAPGRWRLRARWTAAGRPVVREISL